MNRSSDLVPLIDQLRLHYTTWTRLSTGAPSRPYVVASNGHKKMEGAPPTGDPSPVNQRLHDLLQADLERLAAEVHQFMSGSTPPQEAPELQAALAQKMFDAGFSAEAVARRLNITLTLAYRLRSAYNRTKGIKIALV